MYMANGTDSTTWTRAQRFAASAVALAVMLVCALGVGALAGGALAVEQAHADSLSVGTMKTPSTVTTISAKEQKAYNRALAACMDYENRPNPIVVDVSDLELTAKQADNVWEMIHSNGELFWINCYQDTYTKNKLSFPCYYDDAEITAKRKQLDAQVTKALGRLGSDMTGVEKVHMLHDYVLDRVDYGKAAKTAYTALVERKGDCYGLTLAMDLLLRRAGFEQDIAFNESLDHSWNLVKLGSDWFHIDTTWDNGYTGYNYGGNFNWKNKRCHLYLLQSDTAMASVTTDPTTGAWIQSHSGWRCHHACTNTKFDFSFTKSSAGEDVLNENYANFDAHCDDYKNVTKPETPTGDDTGSTEPGKAEPGQGGAQQNVSGFKSAGLKYTVIGAHVVKLAGVADTAKLAAKTLTVPATVTYGDVTYKVSGIAAKAFKATSAKKIIVKTGKLSKARVKNCLKGSQVKKVKLTGAAKAKKAKYKKYFAKANVGKKVTVIG